MTETQQDTAWVTLEIPLPPDALFDFLQNTERLFRLNPYLDIRTWQERAAGKQFHLAALNEMNGVVYDLVITLESVQFGTRLFFSYGSGLKRALEITLQPCAAGSVLTLREHYHPITDENREAQLQEVDHSLTPWGTSIWQYLSDLKRWGGFWPYRWYRENFWLAMRPTHRRIARMLIWITVLEFVAFLLVFTIYWLESA